MPDGLDHVVRAGCDLEAMAEFCRRAGFTVCGIGARGLIRRPLPGMVAPEQEQQGKCLERQPLSGTGRLSRIG
jgi:hypothetical protein